MREHSFDTGNQAGNGAFQQVYNLCTWRRFDWDSPGKGLRTSPVHIPLLLISRAFWEKNKHHGDDIHGEEKMLLKYYVWSGWLKTD